MNDRRNLLFAVIAAAIVVYINALWNGFAYDDIWIVARNDRVHDLTNLRAIWLTPYWPSFGTELGLYRPFAIFMYAVQWAIGGGAPWFFHLVNVLLHAAASALTFLLIERLWSQRAAFAGAIVFAIHPVHTEAVANVVGQGELWAAVGVLLACVIYVRRPNGPEVDGRTRVTIIALYALSLLAKESAVVLPGLLVLLDFVQGRVELNRASMRRYVRAVGFFIALFCLALLAYLTLRLGVLGNLTGTDAAPGLPHLREEYRVLNALRAWPEFVRLLVFPLELAVDYGPAVILPAESLTPMVLLGALLLLVTIVLMLATPWRPRAGLVAGWFFLTILPVSNLLFPIGVLIAERTLYLPSLAVCLAVGYAWDAAMSSAVRETRRLAVAVAVAFAVGFGIRTIVRNPDWDSLTTVWKSLARDHPESYRAQWLQALNEWSSGNFGKAEQYFLLALRIWPRDSQLVKEFGNFYIGMRQFDKAIEYLERSREMTPFVETTHELLAYAYLYGDRPRDALTTAHHVNAMQGTHRALTFSIIAGAYYELGRYDEAAGAWRAAILSKNGDLWLHHAMLARALAIAGRMDAALTAADVALTRTGNQPTLVPVVTRLKEAIAGGCYRPLSPSRPPALPDCDPLQGWAIAAGAAAEKTGK